MARTPIAEALTLPRLSHRQELLAVSDCQHPAGHHDHYVQEHQNHSRRTPGAQEQST